MKHDETNNASKLTGVVHQDVDRVHAEGVQRGLDTFGGELWIRDVACKRGRFPPAAALVDLSGDVLCFVAVEVGDKYRSAMRGEEAGRGGPEALARAGDNGDLFFF